VDQRTLAPPAGARRGDPRRASSTPAPVDGGALDRRDRNELELQRILAEKRVAPEDAKSGDGGAARSGFVDDEGYDVRFAEERTAVDAWGSERIESAG